MLGFPACWSLTRNRVVLTNLQLKNYQIINGAMENLMALKLLYTQFLNRKNN